ncbi:MAG TPA: hypothetical protein VJQ84_05290 [Solirubrobacterales bacterium]|nr:hypothetical protein [Solirubrobacterales bacterium]
MGALVACGVCGFVTRRHSRIGAGGECPDCGRELIPVSFSTARKIQLRKQNELARIAARKLPAADNGEAKASS